jgi:hypothetical protein
MTKVRLLPALVAAFLLAAQPCVAGLSCEPACPMADCSGTSSQWSAAMPCCCDGGAAAERPDPGARGTLSKSQLDDAQGIHATDPGDQARSAGRPGHDASHRPSDALLIQNTPLLI